MSWIVDPNVRTALGIIGNITALGLFLAPVKTFVRICRRRSVEDFSPDPYLLTLLNCLMWTFYGLPFITSNALLVITINSIGSGLQITYLAIFLTFAPLRKQVRVAFALAIEAVLLLALAVPTLVAVTRPHRSTVVGVVADIVNVGMYAAPLLIMGLVIRTRSVEYMPFLLSLNTFVNSVTWTIYAAYIRDIYILIPNVLGTILGATQLILYGILSRQRPRSQVESAPTPPLDKQMSSGDVVLQLANSFNRIGSGMALLGSGSAGGTSFPNTDGQEGPAVP